MRPLHGESQALQYPSRGRCGDPGSEPFEDGLTHGFQSRIGERKLELRRILVAHSRADLFDFILGDDARYSLSCLVDKSGESRADIAGESTADRTGFDAERCGHRGDGLAVTDANDDPLPDGWSIAKRDIAKVVECREVHGTIIALRVGIPQRDIDAM